LHQATDRVYDTLFFKLPWLFCCATSKWFMQAHAHMKSAKVLVQTAEIVAATHQDLSHGIYDGAVPAIVNHLSAADLSGPTSACSLAQVRWRAYKEEKPQKVVTHKGLAVEGIRLIKGGAAFSAASPSGQVALQPTVVRAGTRKHHAIEECLVVDEQARVLKSMYLQDAAVRSARARRSDKGSSAPSCLPAPPHIALCKRNTCHRLPRCHPSWSSPRCLQVIRIGSG
jgi:hypothetical protein